MAFVVDRSDRARVFVSGSDAAAFLHRLSTQHVSELRPGEARLNCFTTDKGRLKDIVHHVVVDDGIWLIGHGALRGADLVAWLDRYLFSEKVVLVDKDADVGAVDVDAATAAGLGADAGALPWSAAIKGPLVIVRGFDVVDAAGAAAPRFVVVGPQSALPAVTVDAAAGRAVDVAAGVPSTEVSEAHTPLDLGLHDAIHWAKGCYIGQEVIARLDTYGKQRKQLVAVVVDADRDLAVGAAVAAEGVSGVVTSLVPRALGAGRPRALAVVKGDLAALDAGAGVDVDVAGPARLVARATAQRPHD
jgi:folate-binding protein YgfZ